MKGQNVGSAEVRARAKEIIDKHGLDRKIAKSLARALSVNDLNQDWLNTPEEAVKYWGVGRDLHDMSGFSPCG